MHNGESGDLTAAFSLLDYPWLGKMGGLGFLPVLKERTQSGNDIVKIRLFTEHISLISVPRLMNLIFDAQTHDSF